MEAGGSKGARWRVLWSRGERGIARWLRAHEPRSGGSRNRRDDQSRSSRRGDFSRQYPQSEVFTEGGNAPLKKKSGGGGESCLKNVFQTRFSPRNFFQRDILSLRGNFRRRVLSGEVPAAARPRLIPSTITASPTLRLVRAQPTCNSPLPPRQ